MQFEPAAQVAYGIVLSRQKLGIDEFPRTTGVVISGNQVSDVPEWHCFDTHGGADLSFVDNVATSCLAGFAIGGSGDFAPREVRVVGNVASSLIESDPLCTDGDETSSYPGCSNKGREGPAIRFYGTEAEAATGSIEDNLILGFGRTRGAEGSIALRHTEAVQVIGNLVMQGGRHAIDIRGANEGLEVVGNRIVDPWSRIPGLGVKAGVVSRCDPDANDAEIRANWIVRGAKKYGTNGPRVDPPGIAELLEDTSGVGAREVLNRGIFLWDADAVTTGDNRTNRGVPGKPPFHGSLVETSGCN